MLEIERSVFDPPWRNIRASRSENGTIRPERSLYCAAAPCRREPNVIIRAVLGGSVKGDGGSRQFGRTQRFWFRSMVSQFRLCVIRSIWSAVRRVNDRQSVSY